ncbi:tail protein X [Citrobacter sp. S2-9]|uniref:Tail protein X n=1 Tax=Citrobacter enshiensis TaxID=2971264 RepID=A0ABT8PRN5_9ENTR|nr:tail protein X [Citrobacter enshiensis]MDN8599005.1 tail protein X [Citrobacter enshiensis]
MSLFYTTKDGDRLDHICIRFYGKSGKTTEEVLYLVANYGVTDMTAVFPAGQVIELPEISPEPIITETQLWE